MPKREDSYWASRKEHLRYCSKHKRYYRADVGCQLCGYEKSGLRQKKEERPPLKRCLECGHVSLFWNKSSELYECLNAKCKRSFVEGELRSTGPETPIKEAGREKSQSVFPSREEESPPVREAAQAPGTGRAWFGNEYFDSKSKKWRKPRRAGISWTALPMFLLAAASVAIIFYILSNFDQLDRAVAIGIISAAAVTAIWHIGTMRRLWKYRHRKAGFGRILFSLILVALIGCSAAAFTGIAPFSDAKNTVVGWFQATPTPTPSTTELAEYMLVLINEGRQANGLSPVVLGTNTAAQEHAEEMLENGYLSHWGLDGMKPYMRYTLAGGYNSESENCWGPNWYADENLYPEKNVIDLLNEAEESLMASSGHRTNILNEWHRKVNIGIAYNKVAAYVVQQFEGDYIRFSQLPTLEGSVLTFSGETLEGFVVDGVQIWYDPPSHSLTLGQLGETSCYDAGEPVAFLRSPPPPGHYYPSYLDTYTWSKCTNPYLVDPDTPPPTPSPYGLRPTDLIIEGYTIVNWVTASHWAISGSSFSISAPLDTEPGVYTIRIWGQKGEDSLELTSYSIFIR